MVLKSGANSCGGVHQSLPWGLGLPTTPVSISILESGAWKRQGARNHSIPGVAGSGWGQNAGQIGQGGGHIKLEAGLLVAEVASLQQPQLHQTGDAMCHCLPQPAIRRRGLTVLEDARCLQQSFLGMQDHSPTASRLGRHTLWPERTGITDRSREAIVPAGRTMGITAPSSHGVCTWSAGQV